jgi:flavin reductase (DIM6/NTAB) family NADH-FMN oxidoreductase RutF
MAPMSDAREFRRSLAAFATGVAIATSSSLAAFARAKYFAINVLTADQRELSQRFSSTVADKFDGVGAVSGHGAFLLITGCAFDRANVRSRSIASLWRYARYFRSTVNCGHGAAS